MALADTRRGDAPTGMTDHHHVVRLEFSSQFEMLDLVQIVSDNVGRLAGLDEDALHWTGVAVRESVINAIKHGNRNDISRKVSVEFASLSEAETGSTAELIVLVRDEGEGFDPDLLLNPLAPENLLKSSGRGIFFMRSFMDDVRLRRMPQGGMEVRMVKKVTRHQ